MLVNTFFENKVEQILEVSRRLSQALNAAGIPYRIVEGLAVFLHVDRVDPLLARLTPIWSTTVERPRTLPTCPGGC